MWGNPRARAITVRALVPPRLNVLRVFGTALAIYGTNPWIVLPVAIVAAFLPAAGEVFIAHQLPDAWAALVTTAIDGFATALFAGCGEELVHRWEEGERRIPLKGVLAKVPGVLVPLFIVGFLQALAVAVGAVLLVVPGFVALTFLSVVGPVVVAERSGVRGAFRRSIRLVRGSGWRVFAVMLGVEVLAALVGIAVALILSAVGETPDEPIGLAIGETFTLPLEALAVPVMYWRLREKEEAQLSVSPPAPPRPA
jgi:hypothetical protein